MQSLIDINSRSQSTVTNQFVKQNGGMASPSSELQEPSIDADKLSYEIFSILESKFLFGYDDPKLWIPRTAYYPRDFDPGPSPRTPSTKDAVSKNPRGRVCILTIDGGGMRGILPGIALARLEQALKSKSGDPNARIADYFDVAAGSGIGGIFTAMLFGTRDGNRPIFRAEDTWRFLTEKAKKFYKPKSGLKRIMDLKSGSGAGTAKVEKAMKEAFGELTLKDTLKPVLIPCYDLSTTAPFLFSRADALERDSFDFRLWEICRATWAEPGLFDPVMMRSVDGRTECVGVEGGLAMSNPTAAAITHVLHNRHEFPAVRGVEDILVISLGTGQMVDVSYDYEQVKSWKAKHWARPIARISSEGSAEFVDQAVAMAFGHFRSSNYVRIQANMSTFGATCKPNVDTDPSPENVKNLTGIAEEMLRQKNVESVLFGSKKVSEMTNSDKIEWFAGELVLEHQRRNSSATPVAFKQFLPRTNRNAVNATLSLISRERDESQPRTKRW